MRVLCKEVDETGKTLHSVFELKAAEMSAGFYFKGDPDWGIEDKWVDCLCLYLTPEAEETESIIVLARENQLDTILSELFTMEKSDITGCTCIFNPERENEGDIKQYVEWEKHNGKQVSIEDFA